MFNKILIANRGEIACRVIRTARRMGIGTVAVYSDADREALHVTQADEAYYLGPAPAVDSYLHQDLILEAAAQSGALAIHPGYGFLSENAAFAEACKKQGFTFIGPSAAAIRAMGDKRAAKAVMAKAGVPLVPGYHGDDQSVETLAAEAQAIGYPVLLKAAAGGGGKGMRVVERAADFADALTSATREAANAFGDTSMLIEKYLRRPRHVEVQVFGDSHGNLVHLFERDCSIQRRHQKIIEEAPAPGLDAALRRAIGAAALDVARAIRYVGAGTVEFLLDEDKSFYFMEMNTRLQVEHPVTEMVTGQDLVAWQICVAAGERLPVDQEALMLNGHAIEARIYAEDPAKDFLPATGTLRHLRPPAESAHVRLETGVVEGDAVSIHYDPMIAKLVVWDTDRTAAVSRLRRALSDFQVAGVVTNVEFLGAVAAHRAFGDGDVDTRFIDRHASDLFAEAKGADDAVLALAALELLLARTAEAGAQAGRSGDPHSPFHGTDGWRMNDDNHHAFIFLDGADRLDVVVHYRPVGYVFDLPGGSLRVRGQHDDRGDLVASLDGTRMSASVVRHGPSLTILCDGRAHHFELFDPAAQIGAAEGHSGHLRAPMPGRIVTVHVAEGDRVEKGAPLLVLEAMKMEHTITAPAAGTVTAINFAAGDQVEEGADLIDLAVE